MSYSENGLADVPAVAIQLSRDVVVASIQVDLSEDVIERFRGDLLQRLHESGSDSVILDLSGLETIDSSEFAALRLVMKGCEIMGARSVMVGLKPGVVSSLVETGADIDGVRTALDLDAAYAMLEPQQESDPDIEPELDPGEEGQDVESGLFTADIPDAGIPER